ncbi:MAG: ABC transporter ATP-binding protein [Acidimicrobiales bacterium]
MLELIELRRRYGQTVALDGLTFKVEPGRVVGFLGPNGAGKTTAMRAIFGVVALDSGQVRWRGRPVGVAERQGFGYMPEERGLYPGMGAGEQLEYLGRLHGLDSTQARKAAQDWIERLGLGGQERTKVEALSLGNQQRVQLAASLVHQPDLLVLDEPFSGLDPIGVDTISGILAERAQAGVTVVFSSHQLDLVEHLCEEVAIIHAGRLVTQGRVEDLARGGTPHLAVKVTNDAEGGWSKALGGIASVTGVRSGLVSMALAPGADPQAVLELARRAGPVEHFAFERRRLSEVFREAVGADLVDVQARQGAPLGPAGYAGVGEGR